MILTRRVALNGVWLDQADSRICISSVEPGDGKENISAVDTAAGYGQRITGDRRTTLDMVVKFRIREKGHSAAGLQGRAEALEKVNEWAAAAADSAVMTVNYKPGRRLNVKLVQAPGEGSLWEFDKEFQITFRAYSVPYWEDVDPQTVRATNVSSLTRSIGIPGSARTPLTVGFKNTSGSTVNTFSVTADGKTVAFSSLGLANNETLVIDTDSRGIFRARIQSTGGVYRSAMAARTAASHDDLMVRPGTWNLVMSAGGAGTVSISYRGRYL